MFRINLRLLLPVCSALNEMNPIQSETGWHLLGDPLLNYFALFLLIFVVVVLFYGIIALHDIPAKIAVIPIPTRSTQPDG
jgi:hypothetical protein